MTFAYQKSKRYFAQFSGGLEDLATEEFMALGARQIKPGFRARAPAAPKHRRRAAQAHSHHGVQGHQDASTPGWAAPVTAITNN